MMEFNILRMFNSFDKNIRAKTILVLKVMRKENIVTFIFFQLRFNPKRIS